MKRSHNGTVAAAVLGMNWHDIYRAYSVLPGLQRLGDGRVFCLDNNRDWYLAEKRRALTTQCCAVEHHLPPRVAEVVCQYIVEQVAREYPGEVLQPGNLDTLALQLQEDLVIHCRDQQRDWFAAGHLAFPSSWDPLEKIGLPFREIHQPVPGLNLDASSKLVEAMIQQGPFERFVWGVYHERRLNYHPNLPKPAFDPERPVVVIKIERQVTVGFPEVQAALFVLRQHLLPEVDLPQLRKAIAAMSPEQRRYKSISPDLVAWLDRVA